MSRDDPRGRSGRRPSRPRIGPPALAFAAALALLPAGPAAAQWCINVSYARQIGLPARTNCSFATQQVCEAARRTAQPGVFTSACYPAAGGVDQPPPDPRMQAVQRVAPKLHDLLARLTDPSSNWKLLGDGWTTLPTGTPEEMQAALQRVFDGLYTTYTRDFAETLDYRLAVWRRDGLTADLALVEPRVAGRKAELAARAAQLKSVQADVARYKTANGQLEAAALAKEQATLRLQDQAIGWIRATLPQDRLGAATWGRWKPTFTDQAGPGETWRGAMTFETGREMPERPAAAAAAAASPAFAPDPKPPLPASIDDRFAAVSRLADKAHDERQMSARANNGATRAAEAEVETLRTHLAEDERIELNGDILAHNLLVKVNTDANALAQLKNDEDVLAKRHAAAVLANWTWENAKHELIETIKKEVTREVLAMGAGRPGFAVDELEVTEAIEHGRANIFGLTDHVMKANDLVEVVKSIDALANHTGDYATAVVRYMDAPPERLDAVVREASEGLDKDAEAIQEASIKATGLREPFGSLWLRLVNRRDAAGP